MVGAMLEEWGASVEVFDIVIDDRAKLSASLDKALSTADVVLINGGSSCGSEDFNSFLLKERASYFSHGIKAVPGRPHRACRHRREARAERAGAHDSRASRHRRPRMTFEADLVLPGGEIRHGYGSRADVGSDGRADDARLELGDASLEQVAAVGDVLAEELVR